jgi:prevent-host-death family protein
MPKTVTASEVKARFGQIVKWTTDNNDEVIVKLYGEPTVVIMPYTEYEALEKLRKQEQKRKVLESLEELRKEARKQNPELTAEEAYRLAGFSEGWSKRRFSKTASLPQKTYEGTD